MKKNERSKFTLAPEYAYGENGSPPKIGQNQTLIFDIELLSWKAQDISEQGDRRLTKSVVKKGQESWVKVGSRIFIVFLPVWWRFREQFA